MNRPIAHRDSADSCHLPSAWRDLRYRVALTCWLGSLVCLEIGFVLWLNVGSEWVALVMRCCFLIAIGLEGLGILFALVFFVMRWSRSSRRLPEAVLPALVIAGLMAFNLVLGAMQLTIGASVEIPRHQSVWN
jgi:hypothetical protein